MARRIRTVADLPEHPELFPATNPFEAERRVSIVTRAAHQIAEIDALYREVAQWNAENPDDRIEIDPDGELALCRRYLARLIAKGVD